MAKRNGLAVFLAATSLFLAVATSSVVGAYPTQDLARIDPEVARAVGRVSALVHVSPNTSWGDGLTAARDLGLTLGTRYRMIRVFVAYGSAEDFVALTRAPEIAFVEWNGPVELFTDTSHRATRTEDVLKGKAVRVNGIPRIDGRGVGVAIVDSGVDGTHPDLASRMGGNVRIVCTAPAGGLAIGGQGFEECRGPKTAVELADTDTPAAGGHGTHVAGIAVGTGEAANSYHGAAPGATLYGVGIGSVIVVENSLDGLAWVLENHNKVKPAIRVVNNSWGSGYAQYDPEGNGVFRATWLLQEKLVAAGITVVFAAGNAGGAGAGATTAAQCVNPTQGIVCVANYDDEDSGTRSGAIDASSSRGSTEDPSSWPDVAAPGTQITSTCRLTLPVCSTGGQISDPPNSYATLSGTSMAAPHVTGIIALLYQLDPRLTPAKVEDLLEDTAFKFGSSGDYKRDPNNPDDASSFDKGHGLVDAVAAIKELEVRERL